MTAPTGRAAETAGSSADERDLGRHAFRLVISIYLAFTAVPPLLNIEFGGRLPASTWGMATLAETRIASLVSSALLLALLASCLGAVVIGPGGRRRSNGVAMAALALLGICVLMTIGEGGTVTAFKSLAANMAIVLALWRLARPLRDLAWFAHCGAALAGCSLAYAVVSDGAWMLGTSTGLVQTKALIGTGLLAGPYPHMNNLGMSVALALPFVTLVRSHWLRAAEVSVLLVALVLTASRTAFLAVAVAAFLTLVLSKAVRGAIRAAAFAVLATTIGVIALVLPWIESDPHAFTERGQIWIWTREAIAESPWNGYGLSAFGDESSISSAIGRVSGAAHNMGLHYLAVGGALALIALCALLWLAGRAAVVAIDESRAPAGFVLTFLILAIAEMPFRIEASVGQAWIGLPGLAAIGSLGYVLVRQGVRGPVHTGGTASRPTS